MPTEVFSSRMHDQINAKLDRTLIDGRGESTVDHGQNAGLFSQRTDFFEVYDAAGWVSRRFDVDQLGVGADGASLVFVVAYIHESGFDAEFREPGTEEFCCSAVDVALGNYVVAAFQQC